MRVDHRLCRCLPAKQRGAAIITALLVVMLAATVATILISQQSEALTRVARATERTQLNLFANTTLEWARTALLVQQKNSTYISLNQPWAQGLIARPIESATASGVMRDAHAKFNINNLVSGDGKQREADIEAFARLLRILKLNPNLADLVADWLDSDDDFSSPGGAENTYYWRLQPAYRVPNRPIQTIDELRRVKDMDDATFNTLSQHITALPLANPSAGGSERTKININTAPAEILQALFIGVTSEEIAEIIRLRELPFKDIADIKERRKSLPVAIVDGFLDVKSSHFETSLAITGESSQVRQTALLKLHSSTASAAAVVVNALPVIIWVKEQ